jgi:DNA-binding PadR family transcriptional regulator
MQWWHWCIGPALVVLVVAVAIWDAGQQEKRELFILKHLVDYRDAYGHELVSYSRGLLKRGTVYITLGMMEQEGLLDSREEELEPRFVGQLPRRVYRITAIGRAELNARAKAA